MTFGERLKDLRIARRTSQRALANAIGIAQTVISRYETNKTKPQIEHVLKLSKALKCTTDYLLGQDALIGGDKWVISYLDTLKDRLRKSQTFDDKQKSIAIEYVLEEINKALDKNT